MVYFFDDCSICAAEGLVRVPGPVEKLGPVLQPDRPSDGRRCMSFASSIVRLADKSLRMYYSVSHFPKNMRGIAVAASQDGLHWEKPDLGQVQEDGKDTNRLAFQGLPEGVFRCGQPQVFQLAEDSWRMYFWVHDRPYLRYTVAESRDGLRWHVPDFERPVIIHPLELGSWIWTAGMPPAGEKGEGPGRKSLDRFASGGEARWGHLLERLDAAELVRLKGLRANDAAYVFRDPHTGLHEFFAPWPVSNPEGSPRRVGHDNAPFMLRAIHRRTSSDGLEWSGAELVIAPDERDRLDQQFYYLAVHRQDEWRIGMLGSYPVHDQTMDIELCFSRDGRRWERPVRAPWVPRGPEGTADAGMVYAPNCLVDSGDHWLLLYTASPHRHNESRTQDDSRVQASVHAARFPKRRFLGLAARGAGAGILLTRPFILNGTELCADLRVDGWLRAELCDPFGRPLPGFEKGRFQIFTGDDTAHVLRWNGVTTEHYLYNAVSLRLEVERGEIYCIHWH